MSQFSRFKLVAIASALAAFGCMAPSYAQVQPEKAKSGDAAVAYVSGGVGVDSQERLNSMRSSYNTKLVFTLNEGNFLANIPVKITDARGRVVVDDVSEGPIFMAKLPAGSYTVMATYDGKTQTRRIQAGSGLRTELMRFAANPATDNPTHRSEAALVPPIERGQAPGTIN